MNGEEIINRLKKALNVKWQKDLAFFLGVTSGAVSQYKDKDSVPEEWLIKVSEKTGKSLSWLRYGDKVPYQDLETKPAVSPKLGPAPEPVIECKPLWEWDTEDLEHLLVKSLLQVLRERTDTDLTGRVKKESVEGQSITVTVDIRKNNHEPVYPTGIEENKTELMVQDKPPKKKSG